MSKRLSNALLTLCAALALGFQLQAQGGHDELAPCGTLPGRSAWLAELQNQWRDGGPPQAARQANDSFYVAVHVHLLGQDDGSGVFDYARYLGAMAGLERDFADSGVKFLVADLDTLASSAYHDHASVLEGADMMFANNADARLNVYFLGNPAGNCGYNLPYAGIAMANQCSGRNSHTLAHEVGHALSLPHPFLGWEGGQTHDGSRPANFAVAAPDRVTYDYTYFQDTLIRDTLIIDTALVELVDRVNCHEAADGFCDTPADYVASRWQCDGSGESEMQRDPTGEPFRSDGSLIMAYSDDACQSRFTAEQEAAMLGFARAERASWVRERSAYPLREVVGEIQDRLPADGLLRRGQPLVFGAVAHATEYLVEVSDRRSFSRTVFTGLTRDTVVALPVDLPDDDYYYRVWPFSPVSHGAGWNATQRTFTLVGASSVGKALPRRPLAVYPNPAAGGSWVRVGGGFAGRLTLITLDGRVVARLTADGEKLRLPNLPRGTYLLTAALPDGERSVARLAITR